MIAENKYRDEIWKDIKLDNKKFVTTEWFQISNYGRIKKFSIRVPEGKIIKPGKISGYLALRLKQQTGKRTGIYIQRLVAQYFIPNYVKEKCVVLHKDFNKENNVYTNLKWATKSERVQRKIFNPNRKNKDIIIPNAKLTETEVIRIKKKINDPNRKTRLKMIAKQFGISEMQLYRIKTGENWGHVKDY